MDLASIRKYIISMGSDWPIFCISGLSLDDSKAHPVKTIMTIMISLFCVL